MMVANKKAFESSTRAIAHIWPRRYLICVRNRNCVRKAYSERILTLRYETGVPETVGSIDMHSA